MATSASHLFAVALGGAVGASLRYLVSVAWLGIPAMPAWPWATFFVNVLGSLAFGLLAVGLAAATAANEHLRFALMTGLLGAFTTYSTFSFEMVRMLQTRAFGLALGYGSGTIAACVLAAGLGLWLGRLMFE